MLAIPDNVLRQRLRNVPLHDGQARDREMYRERLEACGIFLQCLLHYTDVVTLVVGKADDGKFFGLRLDRIAELTGLHERRVDRVVRDLHAAGFFVSKTRAERAGEGYRGLTAVRQLSAELFWAIGLGPLLEKARQRHYARRQAALQPRRIADGGLRAKAAEFDSEAHKRRRGTSLGAVLHRLTDQFKPPS